MTHCLSRPSTRFLRRRHASCDQTSLMSLRCCSTAASGRIQGKENIAPFLPAELQFYTETGPQSSMPASSDAASALTPRLPPPGYAATGSLPFGSSRASPSQSRNHCAPVLLACMKEDGTIVATEFELMLAKPSTWRGRNLPLEGAEANTLQTAAHCGPHRCLAKLGNLDPTRIAVRALL